MAAKERIGTPTPHMESQSNPDEIGQSIPANPIVERSLPIVTPPIPDGGGRIITTSGELTQIINGVSIKFVAYVEFKPGKTRGNHFHRRKTEILYVISGELRARYRSVAGTDERELLLKNGDIVEVPPGWAHAYIATEHTHAVELATLPYDPADTYLWTIV